MAGDDVQHGVNAAREAQLRHAPWDHSEMRARHRFGRRRRRLNDFIPM
jgi:hypothetical protein